MIMLMLQVRVPSEKHKEFVQTALALGGEARTAAGCISHHWYHDLEDRNTFQLIEEWDSDEHLDSHLLSEGFKILCGALRTLGDQQGIQLKIVPQGGSKECSKRFSAEIRKRVNIGQAPAG